MPAIYPQPSAAIHRACRLAVAAVGHDAFSLTLRYIRLHVTLRNLRDAFEFAVAHRLHAPERIH
ncbi:MAG TPA: hypothetical protein VK660_08205, partial [Xanthomonadaceae bacterium]|nr:hypothetical protein [Xanthomonadaceae bacterium]